MSILRSLRRISIGVSLLSLLACAVLWWHSFIFCGWQLPDSTHRVLLVADPQIEGTSRMSQGWDGVLDVHFNDAFLNRRFSSLTQALLPSHVVVLGDLFAHHNLDEDEFELRRLRLADSLSFQPGSKPRMHYLAGNHDIGYGNQMSSNYVDRFDQHYGPLNAVVREDGHLFVFLNAQCIDACRVESQAALVNRTVEEAALIATQEGREVILFLHIPLHKEEGVCFDGPLFHESRGYVTKQNMISPSRSQWLLDTLHPRIIINGHDHEGCRFEHPTGALEYTVRSVMGDYDGNAALLEMAKGPDGSWTYAYRDCPFLHHVKVKVIVGFAFGSVLVSFIIATLHKMCNRHEEDSDNAPQDKTKKRA